MASNGRITVNFKLESIWMWLWSIFKILSTHLPGETKENYKKTSAGVASIWAEIQTRDVNNRKLECPLLNCNVQLSLCIMLVTNLNSYFPLLKQYVVTINKDPTFHARKTLRWVGDLIGKMFYTKCLELTETNILWHELNTMTKISGLHVIFLYSSSTNNLELIWLVFYDKNVLPLMYWIKYVKSSKSCWKSIFSFNYIQYFGVPHL